MARSAFWQGYWTQEANKLIPTKGNPTPEEFYEICNAMRQAYLKEWRKAHPDKVLQQRLRAAQNLLTRHGYTVTEPQPDQTSADGGNGDA